MKKLVWQFVFIAIMITLLVGGFIAFTKHLEDTVKQRFNDELTQARTIASLFQKTFGFTPEIWVRDCVAVGKAIPIFELATVSKTISVESAFGDVDGLTSYFMIVKGEYVIKAGFNLQNKFKIVLTDEKLFVELPPPRILSTELVTYSIVDEGGSFSGLWKTSSKQAVQELSLKKNKDRAIAVADSSGILREAEEQFQSQAMGIFSNRPLGLDLKQHVEFR